MINTKLLDKALKYSLDQYKNFDMRTFRSQKGEPWTNLRGEDAITAKTCNTAECLAGNVIIVALGVQAFKAMDYDEIPYQAAALLGLTQEQRQKLFYPAYGLYLGTKERFSPYTKKYAERTAVRARRYARQQNAMEATA